jgi:hypothetical protein
MVPADPLSVWARRSGCQVGAQLCGAKAGGKVMLAVAKHAQQER